MYYYLDLNEIKRLKDPLYIGRAIGYLLSAYPSETIAMAGLKFNLEVASSKDVSGLQKLEEAIKKAAEGQVDEETMQVLMQGASASILFLDIDKKIGEELGTTGLVVEMKSSLDKGSEKAGTLYKFLLGTLEGWQKGLKEKRDYPILLELTENLEKYLYELEEEEILKPPSQAEQAAAERVLMMKEKKGEIRDLPEQTRLRATLFLIKSGEPIMLNRYARIRAMKPDMEIPVKGKPVIGMG